MRILIAAVGIVALFSLNFAAAYDIVAGEPDLRTEWATIGLSGLLVAWLLARTLRRRTEGE